MLIKTVNYLHMIIEYTCSTVVYTLTIFVKINFIQLQNVSIYTYL